MKKILIFGGTTEGRLIAEALGKSGLQCDVRVATEYGQQVMEPSRNVQVTVGRLTEEEMKDLCLQGYEAVIDATHPFATVVSKNIRNACNEADVKLFRFERKTEDEHSGTASYFSTTQDCIQALKNTSGKILLTTGSKDLHLFAADTELRQRLVVRVLPGMESLKLCYDAGLEGKQIIAMQGPFSVEMNRVQLSEYAIQVLVTKESGKTGGAGEKLMAAEECGVKAFVIQNPSLQAQNTSAAQENIFSSYSDLYSEIQKLTGVPVEKSPRLKITLAGLGPGSEDGMTYGVQKALAEADYIFGAERMIQAVKASGKKMPYYLAKDVVPVVERLQAESCGVLKILVLFSGDTGFYSGQSKLRKELEKLNDTEITVLPGLSSIQVLSAKTGIDWQDAVILSLHGVKKEEWMPGLLEGLRMKKKIFMLTSGVESVREIGQVLEENCNEEKPVVYAGYNLSYSDEKILKLSPSECKTVTEKGLYSLFLITAS